ncbi:MAG: cellulose-binding protein [Elainellaceae cyanobacterium]
MKPSTVTTALIGFGAALLLAVGCHPGSSFLSLPGGPEATQSRAQLAAASPDMPMPGTHQLGTNLTGIADWSTQMPFIDAFKSSRPWISQCAETNSNCGWSTGEEDQLDLDEAGWVRSLPAESDAPQYTRVGTLLFRGVEDYPGGEYVVQYDGQGTLRYDYDAEQRVEDSRPGRDVIDVTPTGQGIYLQITATNPEDYIRNIRVVPAEYESTFEQAPFNPAFLEKTQPYSVLRFMDWMGTNNSEQGDWAERPKPSDATYAHRGVPVEVMVDLANRLERSPWFTMPHQATDTYVQEFARYVRQQLNPDLPIYVEFSNEVWNGQFDQQRYVVEQGRQLDVDEDDFARGRLWFGQRTAEVLQIWDEVFDSDSDRIVGVLGAQAANPWTAKKSLEYLRSAGLSNAEGGIDAIAIAPYIGLPLNRDSVQAELERWIAEGKDAALDRLFEEIITGGVLSEGYEGGGAAADFRLGRRLR